MRIWIVLSKPNFRRFIQTKSMSNLLNNIIICGTFWTTRKIYVTYRCNIVNKWKQAQLTRTAPERSHHLSASQAIWNGQPTNYRKRLSEKKKINQLTIQTSKINLTSHRQTNTTRIRKLMACEMLCFNQNTVLSYTIISGYLLGTN